MENNIVKVVNNDNSVIECILIAIIHRGEELYMIYKEKDNKSFTHDLLASKVVSQKNDVYNLKPLDDNEWQYVETEYQKILSKIERGELHGEE